ncbi:MAG: DUF2336 domain-containing protein [Alphaproteobacteria bacterium]
MSSERVNLSAADVARLAGNHSEEVRAETAAKVARAFEAGLSDSERDLAADIFRALLGDAAQRVRAALSDSLKSSPDVPRDVALTLAADVAEVATPMLKWSEVLTDEDLLAVVRDKSSAHQVAIAQRDIVSAGLADALAETHDENVVATLIGNDGADIAETTLQKVLDEYADSDAVKAPMAHRRTLPLTVSERLVTLVSDQLREHLVTHHALPGDLATDLVLESRERATVSLTGDGAGRMDVAELVRHLARNQRLTPTITLRAVCMGDMAFFECALAELCGIPVVNAAQLINDEGPRGLKAVCKRAGIPKEMFKFIVAAVEVAKDTADDGLPGGRGRFVARMIERVLTKLEDEMADADTEYLIAKLSGETTAQSAA